LHRALLSHIAIIDDKLAVLEASDSRIVLKADAKKRAFPYRRGLLHVEQGDLHHTESGLYPQSGASRSGSDGRSIGMFQTYFILNQQLKQRAVDKMQFMVFSGI
jgi:hypothetical protein